ncbi:MAG: hypothetical protein ABIP48_09815 [Planctomycetota bacterium]
MMIWKLATGVLLAVMTASALTVCTAEGAGVVDTSKSEHARLRSVDMDDVRWTAGFWANRGLSYMEVWIPLVR